MHFRKVRGLDILYDDRDERPGVKFKDADLIGVPYRVIIGRKLLPEGKVEFKIRGQKDAEILTLTELDAKLKELFAK